MYAQNDAQQAAILVEIKGFENSPSLIEELAHAVGQYMIYQVATNLTNIIIREIAAYAKPSLNGEESFMMQSPNGKLFSVIDVFESEGQFQSDVGLLVRIEGNYVVIAIDMNSKLLVDALLQAGVPRSQIILAYAGESVPESV